MAMLAATAAFAMPFVLADGPALSAASLASTFPELTISRATSAFEWPFSVDSGDLACVAMGTQRVVIFSEPWREDVVQEFGNMTLPRSVIVSANPVALLASLEDRALYAPFDSLETLIKRLAPYERMGWKLCDDAAKQPQTGQN